MNVREAIHMAEQLDKEPGSSVLLGQVDIPPLAETLETIEGEEIDEHTDMAVGEAIRSSFVKWKDEVEDIGGCESKIIDEYIEPMPRKAEGHTEKQDTGKNTKIFTYDETPKSRGLSRYVSGKDVTKVTYRERLGAYLHPRDMRKLVTPFSTTNEPELIVRRHVILMNFDPLRAIILRDRLLVLVPDGADSLCLDLERRVNRGSDDFERTVVGGMVGSDKPFSKTKNDEGNNVAKKAPRFQHSQISQCTDDTSSVKADSDENGASSDSRNHASTIEGDREDAVPTSDEGDNDSSSQEDEWDEINKHEWIELPYELQCVDAVLSAVLSTLKEDTHEIQQVALGYIQKLVGKSSNVDDPLTVIRLVKDSVREMNARVNGFVQSLSGILDEDEDMTLMNLSRLLTHPERFIQPLAPEVLEEESDEPELVLEAHLQVGLSLSNSLNLIQGQVDSAAELVNQKLDEVRNKILLANIVISTVSLCVAAGSFIGSIFGMNLLNNYEQSPNAFLKVTVGTISLAWWECMQLLWGPCTFPVLFRCAMWAERIRL